MIAYIFWNLCATMFYKPSIAIVCWRDKLWALFFYSLRCLFDFLFFGSLLLTTFFFRSSVFIFHLLIALAQLMYWHSSIVFIICANNIKQFYLESNTTQQRKKNYINISERTFSRYNISCGWHILDYLLFCVSAFCLP